MAVILFEDDFNGPAGSGPDSSKWSDGFGNFGWDSVQLGHNKTLDGSGHLQIFATSSWGSALETKGLFSVEYGIFSAWIKMPSAPGFWPAFWLLNGNQTSENPVAETDIVEVYTQWPGANQTSHGWNGGTDIGSKMMPLAGTNLDLSAAYHKYTCRIEPNKVTYYFDDVVTGTVVPGEMTWVYGPTVTRGHWIILGLAVGGGNQTSQGSNATMLVDRVEVLDLSGGGVVTPPPTGGAPVANFTFSPQPALINEDITFDASASTGTSLSYAWSGDPAVAGKTGTPMIARWSAANTYNITLTVTSGSVGAAGISKVMIIVEENHSLAEMQAGMPYLAGLAAQYGLATNYKAITHPSLPNYLAIAGGSDFGITDDNPPSSHPITGQSIFGQMIQAGKTAKTYSESKNQSTEYAVKHDPWAYFVDEAGLFGAGDVTLGSNSSGAFLTDILANNLPNLSMVVPNLLDDAHDGTLGAADNWLQGWLPSIMATNDFKNGRLLVIVTADEDDTSAGNSVMTVVLHPSLSAKTVTSALNHYSLTRLAGDLAGTAALRNGASAASFTTAFGLTLGGAGTAAQTASVTRAVTVSAGSTLPIAPPRPVATVDTGTKKISLLLPAYTDANAISENLYRRVGGGVLSKLNSAPLPKGGSSTLSRVIVMMMENTDWSNVQGDTSNWAYVNNTLLPQSAFCTNYATFHSSGVIVHNSLPNYMILESGSEQGQYQASPIPSGLRLSGDHLTKQINTAGLTWKAYHENLPANVYDDPGTPYSADHNANVYFTDVTGVGAPSNTGYATSHIVQYSQFAVDLAAGTLPNYCLLIPNDFHQGEKPDSGTPPGNSNIEQQGDFWLRQEVPKILGNAALMANTLLIVLWDECSNGANTTNGCLLLGPHVTPGATNTAYNHYSTLRTIQNIMGLSGSYLGGASTATDFGALLTSSGGSNTTSQTFVDTTATVGVGYEYLSRGVNTAGQEGPDSPVATAIIPGTATDMGSLDIEFTTTPDPGVATIIGNLTIANGLGTLSQPSTGFSEIRAFPFLAAGRGVADIGVTQATFSASSAPGELSDSLIGYLNTSTSTQAVLRRRTVRGAGNAITYDKYEFFLTENGALASKVLVFDPTNITGGLISGITGRHLGFLPDGKTVIASYTTNPTVSTLTDPTTVTWTELERLTFPTASFLTTAVTVAVQMGAEAGAPTLTSSSRARIIGTASPTLATGGALVTPSLRSHSFVEWTAGAGPNALGAWPTFSAGDFGVVMIMSDQGVEPASYPTLGSWTPWARFTGTTGGFFEDWSAGLNSTTWPTVTGSAGVSAGVFTMSGSGAVLTSQQIYTLQDSSLSAQVDITGVTGAVGSRMWFMTSVGSADYFQIFFSNSGTGGGAHVFLSERQGGAIVGSEVSFTFNSSTEQYWRIKHTTGTGVEFQKSTSGTSWTTVYTIASPTIDVTSTTGAIQFETSNAQTGTGNTTVDNISMGGGSSTNDVSGWVYFKRMVTSEATVSFTPPTPAGFYQAVKLVYSNVNVSSAATSAPSTLLTSSSTVWPSSPISTVDNGLLTTLIAIDGQSRTTGFFLSASPPAMTFIDEFLGAAPATGADLRIGLFTKAVSASDSPAQPSVTGKEADIAGVVNFVLKPSLTSGAETTSVNITDVPGLAVASGTLALSTGGTTAQVGLTWTASPSTDTSQAGFLYHVQAKTPTANWTDVATTSAAGTTASPRLVTGLAPGTVYQFRIVATFTGAEAVGSNTISLTTPTSSGSSTAYTGPEFWGSLA